jgi:2'-5' RNA ligase
MTPNWFVAWPVAGAEEWLAALEAGATGGLRFLAPADLHITLAFLGPYRPEMLKKIASLLKGLPLRELEVAPDKMVALPQPRRFSALAFTLGAGRLEVETQITKWRDRICREAGAKIETRPPLPHLTVARPERRIGEADRDAALEWQEQLPAQAGVKLRLERPRIYSWADRDTNTRYAMLD